jgi:predicted lipoprotein with Yx(FWY)xxD motif
MCIMQVRSLTTATVLIVGAALVACSAGGTSSTPASASPSASESAAASVGSATTVEAKPVGSIGTALVAGSNGMTVYTFTKDVRDSGKSNCTGDCLTAWPALTVDEGVTPSGGSGVAGTLGTITRTDDQTIQVTYNGLPLYFFANDTAPGDANGVYENWEAVKP